MSRKILPITLLLLLASYCLPQSVSSIRLSWDWTEETKPDSFTIYTGDNPLGESYTPLVTVNYPSGVFPDWVVVPMLPGEHYFYVTARNFWGESHKSNIASTPKTVGLPTHTRIEPVR